MFCTNCGHKNEDNANFCTKCGKPLEVPESVDSTPQPIAYKDNSKFYNVLCYIGIFWIIGLLVKPEKDDPRVRFHVGQGIILTIAEAAVNLALNIVTSIIALIFINSGYYLAFFSEIITSLLGILVSVGSFILMVIGIINAVNGVEKPLPIIGQLAFYK